MIGGAHIPLKISHDELKTTNKTIDELWPKNITNKTVSEKELNKIISDAIHDMAMKFRIPKDKLDKKGE